MSLREELEQQMRWDVSEDPVAQRAFLKIDRDELVYVSDEEALILMLSVTKSLRVAIFRLADEIDALKLDSAR